MFSGIKLGFTSVNLFEYEFFDRIPVSLRSFSLGTFPDSSVFPRGLAFLRQRWLGSDWRTLVIWSVEVGVAITIGLIAWSHYSELKDAGKRGSGCAKLRDEELLEFEAESAVLASTLLFNDESDAQYAENLQVQEALLASLENAASSSIQTRNILNSERCRSVCGICFEEKQNRQMFRNISCSHSFCYNCTSKHIIAKIQDNINKIPCPGVDCKTQLDFDACRRIIPKHILVQWDESLCKSLIPESQKLYCPFRDCSSMLVNDSGNVINQIDCPACRRSICARCRVPWHLEFTCKEFRKLSAKRKGKDDAMVKELAKKKSWRKCSNCKTYVEKTEGCVHMTCRCGYEFCYGCGSNWTKCRGACNCT
ncbi:E3 ubiquitin-protein ligase RSL1-like isoform X2 [Diospyros lotus]|uniref:E3 ubiquitin-protein ligase RSL1-like isoform X2 n=1 Tax=Diospyros lotus TaxID=55363 RepID=UPI0022560315|nr:E3 ubiquitin-protein ligase RSL1-like isoform X2 [Diospyros lotus]